jgi:hypothetical protein
MVAVGWITLLNIFLVFGIFVASLSIPDNDQNYDARLNGDTEDERKK